MDVLKAAVLEQLNAPLALRELEMPDTGYGQVKVQLSVSGICGAQLQEIAGLKGNAGYLPHLLGHEGCGRVTWVGPGVTRVRAGDKVVLHWRKAEGIEAENPVYRVAKSTGQSAWSEDHGARSAGTPCPLPPAPCVEPGSAVKAGKVTTFNTHAVVSENRVTPVPAETPDEFCALLGCGLSTALGTIESEAQLKFGEKILVIGCGGLGLNLILAAKLAQASVIAVVDQHESKRPSAYQMGARWFETKIGHLPCGFDVIVDTTGNALAIRDSVKKLAPGGRYVLVGQPKPGELLELIDARHFFDGHEGKSLRATQGGRFQPHRDIPRYVAMHSAGLLKLDGLITHRIPLTEINAGLDLVRTGQAGRVMVTMG